MDRLKTICNFYSIFTIIYSLLVANNYNNLTHSHFRGKNNGKSIEIADIYD